jgi:hypothetical protein
MQGEVQVAVITIDFVSVLFKDAHKCQAYTDSVCDRWMKECGELVEWHLQGKTEVLQKNLL